MSGCDIEPSVNNARASMVEDNYTATATYECLTGFYMSGTARISCNKSIGTWGAKPSCSVIDPVNNVYNYVTLPDTTEDWWYYLLAGLLGLLALLLLCALLWCCCCYHASAVYPYAEPPLRKRRCRRFCCCCPCYRRKTAQLNNSKKSQQNGQAGSLFYIESPDNQDRQGTSNSGLSSSENSNGQNSHYSQTKNRTFDVDRMTPVETPPKDNLTPKNAKSARDPSKELKIWMPHSHGVRNINTSTK